jgi:hypothetical protein
MINSIVLRMRKIPAALVTAWILICAPATAATDDVAAWSISLLPTDFVIGAALAHLGPRRTWSTGFHEHSGAFEIALRKKAVAIPFRTEAKSAARSRRLARRAGGRIFVACLQ